MKIAKPLFFVCLTYIAIVVSAFAEEAEQTYDLDFEGGTLAELTRVLAKAKVETNIVMTPQVQSANAPALRLRNVTTDDLYNMLRLVGNSENYPYILEQAGGGDGKGSTVIWAFRNLPSVATTAEPISVGSLMEDKVGSPFTIEQITSAIQHTVDAFYSAKNEKPNPAVSFQFHKDTKLLIVSGEFQAVTLARKTIEELEKTYK